jgi:hypothetical protein
MRKVPPSTVIAREGHSVPRAPQVVRREVMILKAMEEVLSSGRSVGGARADARGMDVLELGGVPEVLIDASAQPVCSPQSKPQGEA